MALPSPIPDDPRKWDGWNRYESDNLYDRLGLTLEENPSDSLIEENCRQLLVWWQKKLPLKNQPSNPIAQLLRGGMDHAPGRLSEARVELLNPANRARHDERLLAARREGSMVEFDRFLQFALGKGVLTDEEEKHLYRLGRALGLGTEDMRGAIEAGLAGTGAQRQANLPLPTATASTGAPTVESVAAAVAVAGAGPGRPPDTRRVRRERVNDPAEEFRRMLRLSGLDGDAMTDDQRDTFINMAENLGLDPGDAEDLVDDYLEDMDSPEGVAPAAPAPVAAVSPARIGTNRINHPRIALANGSRPLGGAPNGAAPGRSTPLLGANGTPAEELTPAEERVRFPKFINTLGGEMLLIPAGTFNMGSDAAGAPANEAPLTRVTLTRYHVSRQPVTNEQYEKFDPAHRAKRGARAGDDHPVIYVSSLEAIKFCHWLGQRERRRYRLPSEAEWEYAARGPDGRSFPWGEAFGQGNLANFADRNTRFAWSDPEIDDGWAETSPVGNYPLGASPFGVEDCAGNVWEWCLDYYEPYKGTERTNPRGPMHGAQRVLRGGSWQSRFASLKTTTRKFNQPAFASSDVGFRVVCECE